MRALYIVLTAILVASITACGGGMNEEQVRQKVTEAFGSGERSEANKADGKLYVAVDEMAKLALVTARKGEYTGDNNCNVIPQGFDRLSAAINFPSKAPAIYHDECLKVVAVMKAERLKAKQTTVADERRRIAKLKLAAKKAEAKHLAEAKAKAKVQKRQS